ncbi:hypothetical protein BTN50_0221 [Candidatus Enterovibrio altilux]|uniref:Mobile element protein n=1 Tax=Candidatus Enterovibrio altilux TaxID=1927128 RepID=A0A291B6Y3_9GAMM|nr:hypothetical protein BTN50_0221 [Candidatus Enterovibrio luxaltus]
MNKFRYKTTNLEQYNHTLINRGSIMLCIGTESIQLWN